MRAEAEGTVWGREVRVRSRRAMSFGFAVCRVPHARIHHSGTPPQAHYTEYGMISCTIGFGNCNCYVLTVKP